MSAEREANIRARNYTNLPGWPWAEIRELFAELDAVRAERDEARIGWAKMQALKENWR